MIITKYTRNIGKEWTKEDVAELHRLARMNYPVRIIALKLARTEYAIRSKASKQHISLRQVNQTAHGKRTAA